MRPFSLKLLGLLLFSLLTLVTLKFCAPALEANLENKTRTALHEAGLTWADAITDGTKITLSGVAPTTALKTEAEHITRQLWGPSDLSNHITIADPVKPFTLEAAYDGQKISIKGYIADKQSKDLILQAANETFGHNKVAAQLEYAEGQPKHWPLLTAGILQQLHMLNQGKAVFSDQSIHVTGIADTRKIALKVQQALNHYQDRQYRISTHITVQANRSTEFTTLNPKGS